jgi:hypothetical protein
MTIGPPLYPWRAPPSNCRSSISPFEELMFRHFISITKMRKELEKEEKQLDKLQKAKKILEAS